MLAVLLPLFGLNSGPIQANPQGPNIMAGNVQFQGLNSPKLNIVNNSQRAIINWQSFSIAKGEVTNVRQGANAFTLNRVMSGDPSAIYGRLTAAKGGVAVVNPNGIVVHQGGVVDVAGRVVLSTLDIDNSDFLNGGSDRFSGRSDKGVTNFGSISSSEGDVIIMGGFVDNQGQIGALNGTVAIGAGGDIVVDEKAGAKISVKGASDYTGTGINNSGTISGASAELKAHGNVYALAINNGGAIRATGADRSSGRVLLRASGQSSNINLGSRSTIQATAGADGGSVTVDAGQGQVDIGGQMAARGTSSGGDVTVIGNQVTQAESSKIDVSGNVSGGSAAIKAEVASAVAGRIIADSSQGKGGEVVVTANRIIINDNAHLSADGYSGDGRIRIGGDYQGRDTGLQEADSTRVMEGAKLTADSLAGNGGTVIVWANGDTTFQGEISASAKGGVGNGGLVEVSGKEYLYYDGTAKVSTVGGKAGNILFDPGDVVIGATGTGVPPLPSPLTDSAISIGAINDTLQSGANVLVATKDGSIVFNYIAGGGDNTGSAGNFRDSSIQWTNSLSSFGAFAGRSIFVNTHIRTSGAGSINLLAGWTGDETDAALLLAPQDAWDYYVSQGKFGSSGGSIFVGSATMAGHIQVGSRFGDTNVAATNVLVRGSDVNTVNRYAMIGFKDSGQMFGVRNASGGGFALDLTNNATGELYLHDGASRFSSSSPNPATYVNGVGDPIVAVAGNAFGQEKDVNGDGIPDGVMGINSSGVLTDTFIQYSVHFNSDTGGNWWWQQIDAKNPDPLGKGGLRPENGAGTKTQGANINVLATGSITLQGGAGQDNVGASIGHGGPNRSAWGAPGYSIRSTGTSDLEQRQIERIWSYNGTYSDRTGTSIARLAPVYGNINVLAGVLPSGVSVDHGAGTVAASIGGGGSIALRGLQTFKTASPSSNSMVVIGHGGIGQFGEYYGDINVQAGGNISLEAGEATRDAAGIGHVSNGHTNWNVTNVADQQMRFFASVGDFDNPNLRRGELFSGVVTTGFDPDIDPGKLRRITVADYTLTGAPGTYAVTVNPGNKGNYIPEVVGGNLTGRWKNINNADVLTYHPAQDSNGLNTATTNSTTPPYGFAPLTLAPVGPITVAALDGSTVNGLHGNITVKAGGNLLLHGYETTGIAITGSSSYARDSRWAGIGHGGRNFELQVDGAGYYASVIGTPSLPGSRGQEYSELRMTVGNELQTGSASVIGPVGSAYNRKPTFFTITGDIDVNVGKDLTMIAGNDIYDYVRIGHGGPELADYETSSFILGDIRVRVGGDLFMRGGGVTPNDVRGPIFSTDTVDRNWTMRSWAIIGHSGYRNGILGLLGDIDVEAKGNIRLQAGPHTATEAKIGHDSTEGHAQAGGEFIRRENFLLDRVGTDIVTTLTAGMAKVEYSSSNGHASSVVGVRDFSASGAGTLVNANRATADIRVVAGGEVRIDLAEIGLRSSPERLANFDPARFPTADMVNYNGGNLNDEARGVTTRNNYAQIGHGGIATQTLYASNTAMNYADKVGNIFVQAMGGDVVMENGTGEQRWARIGHSVGAGNRQIMDDYFAGYSRAIEMAGDIRVKASGDIIVNAAKADANDRIENHSALFGSGNPSRWSPVVIGHGGIFNNVDIVVLGKGENVNGVIASSDIALDAGGDLKVLAGQGTEAMYAQVGHGFASDQGDDFSRRMGVPTGFAGDIDVNVKGGIQLEGGSKAWIEQPSGIGDNEGISVIGAYAAIGHGGFMLDAPSSGDIRVYAGRDINIQAQVRTDPYTNTIGAAPYAIVNPTPGLDSVASGFNFAKIGHVGAENNNRQATAADWVMDVTHIGDITVVVGRDLNLKGGTTPNVDTQTIYGAFAQIGHGGPSVTGDLFSGDITVLVKRDLAVQSGSEIDDGKGAWTTATPLNNYAMIGHGDKLRGTSPSNASMFRQTALAVRQGDIVVAVGKDATFEASMVGHLDPSLAFRDSTGSVKVAVSRLDPFFTGPGKLTATRGSVFASGSSGVDPMQFFIPARSNNLMDNTTRINEKTLTFTTAPANFAAPFNAANGMLAGRADEVYLTPDLWWDQTNRISMVGISGGGVFPGDASGNQGGEISHVNAPGGLINLASMTPGSLGDSATIYRDNNGVSGAGHYTLYYDAIRPVLPPTPPVQPTAPDIFLPGYLVDYSPVFFTDTYDSFIRAQDLAAGIGGQYDGLYDLLGMYERDEDTQESNGAAQFEKRLDKMFGPRRDPNSFEEQEEEERRKARRGSAAGQVGVSYYIYEPGTNRYSSYRVFGNQITNFYPAQ